MWQDYVKRLQDRNPELLDREAKMTLTVASFLKQLERAYEAGKRDSDMFDQLFGGGKR